MQTRKRLDWKMICFCSLGSIGLIIISNVWANTIKDDSWRIIVISVLTTTATALIANTLWEVVAKYHFAEQIREMVNISESLASSGIERVFPNFLHISWQRELANAKSLDVVFVYGRTWRESNRDILARLAKNSKVRIVVPDPTNVENMSEFDRRFSKEPGGTKVLIEECIKFFAELGAEVLLFNRTLQASYYRTDQACYMSFLTHSVEKGTVPAIKAVHGGEFHTYISHEIDSIIGQSKPHHSSKGM